VTTRQFVEIHAVGGAAERHEIVGQDVRVGSGATCAIRPRAANAFRAEHILLTPSDSGCRVRLAQGVQGPLMFGGAPQWEVLVPWGDEVFLEGMRFTFLRERRSSMHTSPVLWGTAVVLALTALFFAQSSEGETVAKRELEPVALLVGRAHCPESDPSHMASFANQAEQSALAKEERTAFDTRDGAQALTLLRDAAACYQAAAENAESDRANLELTRWLAQMNEDYAATRLRLRLALQHQRWSEALEAVEHIQALLVEHSRGPYLDWLSELRSELQRRAAVVR